MFATFTSFIGLWCNGNTADFGSVVLGSSPSRPTKFCNSKLLVNKLVVNMNRMAYGVMVTQLILVQSF